MANTISAPALVYCSCTKPKTGEDSSESNFEIYRYLTVDPNGDRNIFCRDYPFVFSDDTKPYINIEKPFPYCRSENYGFAVQNLEEYARNRCMEAIIEKADKSEILMWSEAEANFHNAYMDYQQKQDMKKKEYTCLLQVVDRWFNVSSETINDYFTWSKDIKERLELIKDSFWQVVSRAKKNLKDAQPSVWERLSDAITELMPRMEDVVIDLGSGTFSFNFKEGARRFNKSWNSNQSLSWFDDRMKEMKEILDVYADMVCDEVFFAENQDYMNNGLGEARDLFLEFQGVMSELEYEDDLEFNEALEDFKSKLDGLVPGEGFKDGGKNFLTNESMLVCRCGGVINIVYDGQALNKNFTKVEANVLDLLKYIERDLYEVIYSTEIWDCWQMAVSFIDAYNFVRYILLSIGQTSQFDNYIIPVYNNEELGSYGVEMNISIQSRSVLNKKIHKKNAVFSLIGSTLGALSIKIGTFFSIVSSTTMVLVDPSDDNIGSLLSGGISEVPEKTISNTGKLLGVFYIIKGFASALADIDYSSTADYIGEINLSMKVGTHDITYIRSYDINGTAIGSKPDRDMSMRMKPFYRLDASRAAYVSGEELYLLNFDNTINVDTTFAVDAGKIENIKKEYIVDEEGVNEK